jgi:flavin-dependent dehydrogenase
MPDVIVVGGGPAGSATATLFAAQGYRVLVLDAATFPRHKPCAEYVSPGAVAILDRLGVLERLRAARAGRLLRGMEIVAPSGGRHLVSYTRANGETCRGLSVPRVVLDAVLLDVARDHGAEIREGVRARAVWREAGRVRGVIGPAGERLSADLVVGADGLNSVVARAVGRPRRRTWPRRLGLVAHVAGVAWPEDHGRMFVGRHGYVGVAPLDDRGLVTVGLVRGLPRQRLGSPAAAMAAGLAEFPDLAARLRGGSTVGSVTGIGPLARRVARAAGPGYALVGDAAGFFDPFTGEGIFRALRGAELLTHDPSRYAVNRGRTFGAKTRLVALIQVIVQTPRLMDFAIRRLAARPDVARELGAVLGDLEAARLDLVWRLLGP